MYIFQCIHTYISFKGHKIIVICIIISDNVAHCAWLPLLCEPGQIKLLLLFLQFTVFFYSKGTALQNLYSHQQFCWEWLALDTHFSVVHWTTLVPGGQPMWMLCLLACFYTGTKVQKYVGFAFSFKLLRMSRRRRELEEERSWVNLLVLALGKRKSLSMPGSYGTVYN